VGTNEKKKIKERANYARRGGAVRRQGRQGRGHWTKIRGKGGEMKSSSGRPQRKGHRNQMD